MPGYASDNIAFNNAMDSLSHYGVKGMEWGKRNEDTLRKYGLLENLHASAKDSTIDLDDVILTGSSYDREKKSFGEALNSKILELYVKKALGVKQSNTIGDKIANKFSNMRLSMAMEMLSKSGLVNSKNSKTLSTYESAKRSLKEKGDSGIPNVEVRKSNNANEFHIYAYRKKN